MNIDDLIQRINGALNEPMGRGDERRVRKVLLAALASPPSAPAASGAPPHDAAEELVCLREMYQDVLRDMDSMLTDFAAALGLPDPIQGTESPGYPHILRAINVLKARVTMGDGGACSLCGAARLYRENHWLCSNPECPASVVTALSPQASDRAMTGPDVVRDALTDADASWAEYRGVDYWTGLAEAASRAALREGAPAAAVPSPPAMSPPSAEHIGRDFGVKSEKPLIFQASTAAAGGDEDDRETCKLCGRVYGWAWTVSDAVWETVTDGTGKTWCLECFDQRAHERGVDYRPSLTIHGFVSRAALREAPPAPPDDAVRDAGAFGSKPIKTPWFSDEDECRCGHFRKDHDPKCYRCQPPCEGFEEALSGPAPAPSESDERGAPEPARAPAEVSPASPEETRILWKIIRETRDELLQITAQTEGRTYARLFGVTHRLGLALNTTQSRASGEGAPAGGDAERAPDVGPQ
ncbi:MAG TPA: hypothetical protein VFO31_26550 [Vicinamibacterales bacterium]|nr:hypothetical protein [Vicinamibacterales bacterium]